MTESEMQKARDTLVNTFGLRKQKIERLTMELERDKAIVKLFNKQLKDIENGKITQ